MKALLLVLLVMTLYLIFYSVDRIKPVTWPVHSTPSQIPRVIFRTIGNLAVNDRMHYYCHQKWVELNPTYLIVWYTNEQCDRFMKKFDEQFSGVLHAYNSLLPGAFKADLWRLCILYKFGGVYVDAFATPFKSMDEILKNTAPFVTGLDPNFCGGGIHNGFIATTKGHPFIRQCILDIIDNVKTKNYGDNCLDVTGPSRMRKSMGKVLGIDFKPTKGLNTYSIPFYLFELQFGPRQYLLKNGMKILSKKYSIFSYFYEKIVRFKTTYAFMWKNRQVFR